MGKNIVSCLHPKEATLAGVEQVAVVCSSCHYSGILSERDAALDYALVYGTYLNEAREELRMWVRAEQLFARFPASGHWLKVMRTRPDRPYWPHFREDPELESALLAEPDLYAFLRNNAAYLPGRMRHTKELIQKWEAELDFKLLKCPVCDNATLTLEPELFGSL